MCDHYSITAGSSPQICFFEFNNCPIQYGEEPSVLAAEVTNFVEELCLRFTAVLGARDLTARTIPPNPELLLSFSVRPDSLASFDHL